MIVNLNVMWKCVLCGSLKCVYFCGSFVIGRTVETQLIFTGRSKVVLLLWIVFCYLCFAFVFIMLSCLFLAITC